MVFVNDKKYACATCIKGHRSSSCVHKERPLFEIKRKGRPQTQCPKCRKLRKTRQTHIRCECPIGVDGTFNALTVRNGETLMYPNGLPDILRSASVLAPYPSSGRVKGIANPCKCGGPGGGCSCATSRPPIAKGKQRLPTYSMAGSSSLRAAAPARLDITASASCPGSSFAPTYTDEDMIENRPPSPESEDPVSDDEDNHSSEEEDNCCGSDCSCRIEDETGVHRSGQDEGKGKEARETNLAISMAGDLRNRTPWIEIVNVRSNRPPPSNRSTITPTAVPTQTALPTRISLPSIHTFDFSGNSSAAPRRVVHLAQCNCGWSCVCPGCNEHSYIPVATSYSDAHCPKFCNSCNRNVNNTRDHTALYPFESVDAFLARQARRYDLPPAPPSRAGNARLETYSRSTFVLSLNGLRNAHVARASGVGEIRKLCCGGRCACVDGECRCPRTCAGSRDGCHAHESVNTVRGGPVSTGSAGTCPGRGA